MYQCAQGVHIRLFVHLFKDMKDQAGMWSVCGCAAQAYG